MDDDPWYATGPDDKWPYECIDEETEEDEADDDDGAKSVETGVGATYVALRAVCSWATEVVTDSDTFEPSGSTSSLLHSLLSEYDDPASGLCGYNS
jgi:hypothetical protein